MRNLRTAIVAAAAAIGLALSGYCAESSSARASKFSLNSAEGASVVYVQRGNAEMDGIVPPNSARELLANIKWAVDQKVFLRGEFFTEENIELLLGSYPLRWAEDVPHRKYVEVERAAATASNAGCVGSAVMSWLKKRPSLLLSKAQVSIAVRWSEAGCSSFSADAVREAFGEPKSIRSVFSAWGVPSPHRELVPMRTSHPWGNTDVEYEIHDGRTVTRLKLEIIGNGVVRQLIVLSEEF